MASDDYTLMTTESMALVLNDDGCCVRHPSVKLKEYDDNGDVYLKESCPTCQEEFEQTQQTLLQKRKELNAKLQNLSLESTTTSSITTPHDEREADDHKENGNDDDEKKSGTGDGGGITVYPPPPTITDPVSSTVVPSSAPTTMTATLLTTTAMAAPTSATTMEAGQQQQLTLENLAGHMVHIQHMQDILMFQKEKEVSELKQKVEDQQRLLTEKQVEIALLQERLSQSKLEMEKELKLIKRAVAMDRERRLHHHQQEYTPGGGGGGQDIHIAALHVHPPAEGMHAVQQAAARSAQEYVMSTNNQQFPQDNKEEEEEIVPPLVEKRSRTGSADEQNASLPTSLSKEMNNDDDDKKASLTTTVSEEEDDVVMVPLPSSSKDVPNDDTSSPPPPPPAAAAVSAKVSSKNESEIHFVPTHSEQMMDSDDIHFVPSTDDTPKQRPPAQLKVAPDEEENNDEGSLDDNFERMQDENVAKLPEDMWEEKDDYNDDDAVESEEEDAFDAGAFSIENAGEASTKARKSKTPPRYKKPGPLTTPRAVPTNLPDGGSKEHRGEPLMASLNSLEPPAHAARAGRTLQPASNGIPTVSEFAGGRDSGPVHELEIDNTVPPEVPLSEQVTLGTLEDLVPSDRFRPRPVAAAAGGASADDGTIGQTTVGPTVASSTYGEDRQLVKNKLLLDPYGDKGMYSGVVLMSTGLPHGNGKMVYEDDGRTYAGDWRHGRWNGWGRATFSNGDSFEGYYKYDQRHGQGKYSWKDGRIYEGEFKEDKRHGKGHFYWPDGAEYIGQFSDGQRHGRGEYRFSDGGRYVGEWVGGRYEGYGECVWADGRVYKGQWKAGMAHGQGTETYPDGRIRHSGQWIEDEPIRKK